MKLQFTGIVRDIKEWDKDKKTGELLPVDKVRCQVTFMDRGTGGDVVITFPHGHGYIIGQEVEVKTEVKPQVQNFRLALYAVTNLPEPAAPSKK